MPKKKGYEQIHKEAMEYFAELDIAETKRLKKRAEFIESIQALDPIAKASAWLNYVANDIRDYGDQEALVYISCKGFDFKDIVYKLLNKWKDSEKRSVEMHFSTSSTVYNVDTGKSRTEKRKIDSELYKILKDTQPDFWYGRDGQEYSIDATMLRTVEWCEIGGFEDYWIRNANHQYESLISNGIEPIPASFYVFNMCRSELGIQLNDKSLKLMLDAMEVPEETGEEPWKRRFWRIDPPRLVENFAYAATIAFSGGILLSRKNNKTLVEKALNLLLKHQENNGGWKCWSSDEYVSIEITAMVIHALAINKPRGWEIAVSRAKDWLLSIQDRSGYWYDEGCPDVVYLTVLVLDAIELASGGTLTTLKTFSQKKSSKGKQIVKKNEKSKKQPSYYEVIMGNKYVGGNNNSGIQYVGEFHDVITNLRNIGQADIANALLATRDAILSSESLSNEKKKEHIEVLDTIGNEISKPEPNKTLIKMLGEGLLSTLKVVPDIAKAAIALAPLLAELAK